MNGLEMLLALLMGHAFADFALQNDFVAKFKAPFFFDKEYDAYNSWWPWVLGSHALMHGGVVWLITGSAVLAIVEIIAHFVIDLAKCMRVIGFHKDQALHILCKVVYVAWLIGR